MSEEQRRQLQQQLWNIANTLSGKMGAFVQLCRDEQIEPAQFEKLLQNYVFANRLPRDQEIVESLSFKPKILERKSILERIGDKIQAFIHTYVEGMGGSV